MEGCMNEMELLDGTTVAGLPKDRFDEMERRYNSRSYRCALHMRAMLRRPKTARFHWQGILRELSGVEVRWFPPACSMQSSGLITRETAHFELRKEPNYFTRLNNYN
jgi:hypothetical protein